MRRLMPSVPMILILGGCATPGEKTAIGAGAGAAVGAGVGALAGGWEGAAIGAVVGGVAGGAIGNYLDKQAAAGCARARRHAGEDSFSFSAIRTSSASDPACIFRITCPRCTFTVISLVPSC